MYTALAVVAGFLGCGGEAVTAFRALPEIRFVAGQAVLRVGASVSLQLLDENGASANTMATFEVADTLIARVSADAVLTGLRPGNTVVTARRGPAVASIAVAVTPVPVARVTIAPDSLTMFLPGPSATLTATTVDSAGRPLTDRPVTYRAVDNAIVQVSTTGTLTAVAVGRTLIIASSESATDTAVVVVDPAAVVRVRVSTDSVRLYAPGGAVILTAEAEDAAGAVLPGRTVVWSTTAPGVATVSPSGNVQSVNPGTALVVATIEGRADSTIVVVEPVPVARVIVSPDTSVAFVPGGTDTLTVSVRDSANGVIVGRPVLWRSLDPAFATVNSIGVVAGQSVGIARIVATADARADTAIVIVRASSVARVRVTPDSIRLYAPGGLAVLSILAEDAAGTVLIGRTVVWSSSTPGVATVSTTGTVRSVSPGTARVIGTSEGRADTTIVVVEPVPVAAVILSPDSVRVFVPGGTATFAASVRDSANGIITGRAVTWRSTDTTVATVSAAGVVAARALGTTRVIVTADTRADTAIVVVEPSAVARLRVTPDSVRLYAPGGSVVLSAQAEDAAGVVLTGRTVVWSTTASGVATVSQSGAVQSVSVGTARIVATLEGKADTTIVVVEPVPVARVIISPDSVALFVPGGTATLVASVRDSANGVITGRTVTWRSTDSTIATVSATGAVVARLAGLTQVIATSGARSDTASVLVEPSAVARVRVTPDSVRLFAPGGSVVLTAQAEDAAGTVLLDRPVVWSTTAAGVATVSPTGTVQSVSPGIARIIATAEVRADTTIVVVELVPVARVILNADSIRVFVPGGIDTLTASVRDSANGVITGRALAWRSTDTTVATVNGAGVVAGRAVGTTRVIVTVGARADTAVVTVLASSVSRVRVTPDSVRLYAPGGTVVLTARAEDGAGTELTGRAVVWSSSAAGVASVSQTGSVLGLTPGTARIVGTSEGKADTTIVVVEPVPVTAVIISPDSVRVFVPGGTATFTASVRDSANGVITGRAVTWRSTDTTIATVSVAGVVAARAVGTTRVIVTADTRADTALVVVEPAAVGRVRVTPDSVRLYAPGGSTVLTAQTETAAGLVLTGRSVVWSTTAAGVATVSQSGAVQSVSVGTARIVATSEGQADTTIVVVEPVPVAQVIISPDSVALFVPGGTATFVASVRDSANGVITGRTVTWRSIDSTIATVSATGVVVARLAGLTQIIATAGARSDTAIVFVEPTAVARVRVTPDSVRLYAPGGSVVLTAQSEDFAGTVLLDRPVVWSTTAAGVATVSQTGTVLSVSPGIARIIATVEVRADTTIIVVEPVPVAQVIINPDSVRLLVPGGTATFTASVRDSANGVITGRALTWRTLDTLTATVTSAGVVSARAVGTTRVIVTADARADTAIVVVQLSPVARVRVTPDSVRLYAPGGTTLLTAQTEDSAGTVLTGRTVVWSTTAAGVATVSQTGTVLSVAPGTARIIATSEGRADSTIVVVQPVPVAAVIISPDSVRVFVPGGTATFTASVRDSANGVITGRAVTWRSTDTTIATVSAVGVVSARAVGTARVIATSDARADSAIVVVQLVPVSSVVTTPDSMRLFLPGGTRTLGVTLRDSANTVLTGRSIVFSSTDSLIARITTAGVVQARALGTVRVIATSEGRADSTIVVVAPVPVVSVSVTPATASVPNGSTQVLSATPRDSVGGAITGRTVTWTSLTPSVATVSPATGASTTVTGVALGSSTIRATVDGIIGTSAITVTNPPQPFSGTVQTAGAVAVGGGSVQVFDNSGATLLTTVPVNGAGQWSVTTLVAGTYRVVLQPPTTHSMGPAEGAFRSVTTPTGVSTGFVVQPAVWFDDFQSYADSAALHSNFGVSAAPFGRAFFPAGQITLDPTGGPTNSRAMRYNFRVNGNSNQDLFTVIDYRAPTTAGATVDTLWFRFTTRESPGFETGCATCGNFAYKFFLVGIGRSTGYPNTAGGRFGMYLQGPANAQTMGGDMNDRNPDGLGYAGHFEEQRHQMGPNTGWTGTWNTWMMRIAFTGPTTATFTMYRNGQQIATTLTNRYLTSLGDRQLLDIELGSTLNSGPTVAQQRWWRDVGIYRTRPTMLPSFPLNP